MSKKVDRDNRTVNISKRKCKFRDFLRCKYPCFTHGRSEWEAKCMVCDCYISMASRGALDLDRHVKTTKHIKCFQRSSPSNMAVPYFTPKVEESVGALSFQTVRHHPSYRSTDCALSLLPNLLGDSEMATRLACAQTKTEPVDDEVLPHSLECVPESVGDITFLGIATDVSNRGGVKLFPVIVQYFDWRTGIVSKILDLSYENETPKAVSNLLIAILEKHGINDKCISFCGDCSNVNFGGINSPLSGNDVFSLINNVLPNDLIGIGCPAHILHNTLQHGTDLFPVDVESIVLKIFNFFSIYNIQTEKLKEFCDFVCINYAQLFCPNKTRWLSLFPAIEQVLKFYPELKSYFLSEPGVPRILNDFFRDEFSEIYLCFVHSLMNVFYTTIIDLEKERSCLLDVMRIQNSVSKSLENRLQNKFMPMKVSQKLENLREGGLEMEVNNFIESGLSLYQSCKEYLDKWTVQFAKFQCFYWLDMKYLREKNCSFNDIIPCIQYVNGKQKCVMLDDVKLFDEFCAVKEFVLKQEESFFLQTIDLQWSRFFEDALDVACFQQLLYVCQFFFSIIARNSNAERVLSSINAQWSDERDRLPIGTVKGML